MARAAMTEVEHYHKARRRLRLRRLIGVLVIVAFGWLLFWVFAMSGLADPVIQTIGPFYKKAGAMINDPLGIDWGDKLMAVATIMVPHLGILFFIFDNEH